MYKKLAYWFVVFVLFLPLGLSAHLFDNRPIILIDPAGHAKDVGRWLVEGYERAQTLKFAYALKKELLKTQKFYPVISRSAGEEILPLQIASFSNRLRATFFLRIGMYREESEKPKIFLYHLVFDPIVDFVRRNFDSLSFIPLHQAHFMSIERTKYFGNRMYEYLNSDGFRRYFDCFPLRGLPVKSTIGVIAPSIEIEIGICRENKAESLVRPVVESLSFLGE